MKFLITLFLITLACQTKAANDSTKVLFIGNSMTYYNDMPLMFRDIASSKGKKVSVSMYAPGGSGIVNHYVDPAVFSLLRDNQWDVVVLQPGTGESAGASSAVATTIARSKVLLDSIYNYSPCAKVYLYEIPYGVPSATNYANYFSVQKVIKDSVTKMTDALHVQMIAAGECARAYYSLHENLLLHGSYNDVHPSANGSFLIASSFYAGIFQDSTAGSTFYATIPPDTARKFFSIADTVILNHLAAWRINTYNLHAGFGFTVTGPSVAFTGQAANYTSVLWKFGDNTTATALSPTHMYAAAGNYSVKMYAYNGACADSFTRQVQIQSTGINESAGADNGIRIFPNPVRTSLHISHSGVSENLSCRIINAMGQLVQKHAMRHSEDQIDVSSLPAGNYLLQLFDSEQYIGYQKFIKTTE